MTRRRGEGNTLLWVGLGCGGGALLGLLLLGGGVAALWATGHLGHRKHADAAGANSDPAATNPVVPFLPAGNPFTNPPANPFAGRKLTGANCAKLKLDQTEAEVRALLGRPTLEMPGLFDVKGMGGMAEQMADQWPVKVFSYQEGANNLVVHFNRKGHLVMAQGEVDGQPVFLLKPINPFENVPPGELGKQKPFERFPANPFFPGPGGVPGMPAMPGFPGGMPPLGGAARLTQAAFNRVQVGMSEAEVVTALGPPTMKMGPAMAPDGKPSSDSWWWATGASSAMVFFRDGRVVGKQAVNLH